MRFFLVAEVINSSFPLIAVLYLYHWIHLGWTFRLFSVQFSCSALSNSLWPYGLQHTRLPCPSPIPRACSNSCASSQWCHATIWSSVVPFSSCLQSFPASGSFPMSQFFSSGGQSIGASASVLPMNIQDFRIDWFDLLAVQGTLKSLLQHHSSKASILVAQPSLWSNSHIYTWSQVGLRKHHYKQS